MTTKEKNELFIDSQFMNMKDVSKFIYQEQIATCTPLFNCSPGGPCNCNERQIERDILIYSPDQVWQKIDELEEAYKLGKVEQGELDYWRELENKRMERLPVGE